MESNTVIEIRTATIWKIIVVLAAAWLIYTLRDFFILLLFAVVIASAIDPVARWLQRRRIPRVLAVLAIYIGAFLVFSLLVYLVIGPLIRELRVLAENLPQFLQDRSTLDRFVPLDEDGSIPENMQDLIGKVTERLAGLTTGAVTAVFHLFGGIVSAFSVLVMSLYLSVREKGIEMFLRTVIPQEHEEYVIDLWTRTQRRIGRWLQGQLLLIFIIGLLVYIGLRFIFNMEYALIFAVLAGMLEIVPVVGPIVAVIPPLLVALTQSPLLALGIVLFYIIIQQLENHLIVPQIIQKLVGVDALAVIIALLIGGHLAGLPGVILSVPVAAGITELFGDVQKKRASRPASAADGSAVSAE